MAARDNSPASNFSSVLRDFRKEILVEFKKIRQSIQKSTQIALRANGLAQKSTQIALKANTIAKKSNELSFQVLKELRDMREDNEVHQFSHQRVNDDLSELTERVDTLEKTVSPT